MTQAPVQRRGARAVDVAALYLRAAENELALDWLERAFVDRNPNLAVIGVAPPVDPIRDHPWFQDLLPHELPRVRGRGCQPYEHSRSRA